MRFERLARKAKLFVPVLLALAVGFGAGWQLGAPPASADERAVGLASGLDAGAKSAVEKWVDAVVSGDADIVGAMLAPEFQLVRSDGAAYDAAEYLARGIPRIDAGIEISGVVTTGFGDHMVVRYVLDLRETVGGGRIAGTAPRLTVFRRDGDDWLVVAHANFGQVEK